MHSASINRFEWLKAVLQVAELSGAAKNIASALAVQFANDESGQINPKKETLATYLSLHLDTVKRALRELRDAGWLTSHGNGGRSRAAAFVLCAPGRIIAFRSPKKEGASVQETGGKSSPPSVQPRSERGGHSRVNRGQKTPTHIEQSSEQKARAGSERPAPQCRRCIRPGSPSEERWNQWLSLRGYSTLAELGVKSSDAEGRGWDAPFTLPPKPDDIVQLRIAEKWAEWATGIMWNRAVA